MDRPDALPCAVFVVLAFAAAGVVHAAWLRSRLSAPFRIPLDGRRTLAGKRIFGDNKTWCGFMVMIPAVATAFAVLGLLRTHLPDGLARGLWPLTPGAYALLGGWAGFGFMAAELPNSFCKRRLGIGPGAAPDHRLAKPVCFLVDRLDSIAGAFLALILVVPMSLWTWVFILLVGPPLHWLFSALLFHLGVKARPA